MKKRIILMIALGISFTPALFAGEGPSMVSSQSSGQTESGEQKFSQVMTEASAGVACGRLRQKDVSSSSGQFNSSLGSGSASSARD